MAIAGKYYTRFSEEFLFFFYPVTSGILRGLNSDTLYVLLYREIFPKRSFYSNPSAYQQPIRLYVVACFLDYRKDTAIKKLPLKIGRMGEKTGVTRRKTISHL